MRVAILAWGGARFFGVWNYYLNMARVLARFQPDIRCVLFCPSDLPLEHRREAELTSGEPVHDLPLPSRIKDGLALAGFYDVDFAKRFRAAAIDVVFEQAKYLGPRFPLPVLPWVADLQHRSLPEYFSASHRLVRDVGFWAQVRYRSHVLVSSQATRQDLLDFVRKPNAEIHVVPFAVLPIVEVTARGIWEAQRQHGLTSPYLFLPNQLWRHKNHGLAFRALADVESRGEPWTLALSGQKNDYRHPGYADELMAVVRQIGIEDRLKWLGTVPYADLLHLTAGASVMLNPSHFEGWSTTVEEAKTLAVPMALSDIAVHREQAGDQATFFNPHDPSAMADAILLAHRKARTDRSAARAEAASRNLVDQEVYALRLRGALEAAIADH